jgi:ribonuclease HI
MRGVSDKPHVTVFTDGACSGNPGPGGWGVLMIAREDGQVVKERTLQGGEALTTNNRMELLAAISALEALAKPVAITIITDSAYVKNGITDWMDNWKRKGWRTAAGPPVKNVDLWQRLDAARTAHLLDRYQRLWSPEALARYVLASCEETL